MPKEEELGKISKKSGGEFYNNLPKGYKRGRTKYIVVTGSVIRW